MDQTPEQEKKVSIGDAIDAIRKGKNLSSEAQASTSKHFDTRSDEAQRISPAYWLENLQQGLQQSRDQLFESIAKDPTRSSGMTRRDLHASESFSVPSEWLDEVDLTKPVEESYWQEPVYSEITSVGQATEQLEHHDDLPLHSSQTLELHGIQVEEITVETTSDQNTRINPITKEIFKKATDL